MNIVFLEDERQIKVLVYKPVSELIGIDEKFNSEMQGILFCSRVEYIQGGATQFTIDNSTISRVPQIYEWFYLNCK